jgi:hypothetical protein
MLEDLYFRYTYKMSQKKTSRTIESPNYKTSQLQPSLDIHVTFKIQTSQQKTSQQQNVPNYKMFQLQKVPTLRRPSFKKSQARKRPKLHNVPKSKHSSYKTSYAKKCPKSKKTPWLYRIPTAWDADNLIVCNIRVQHLLFLFCSFTLCMYRTCIRQWHC